ncbi:aryl-alcohol dehydrogenase-like predicted oxidoreductase [Salirhabdus euzebyi]|uniref:Aryl-alcohol dehydrogenase-like predicted oxidoreductase n=1 Tax=Salirhabdus euzebyi TaxID=394506 RepID=A0A841QA67_9BACI|nr:aldo/keto reductase [Salirhabdus euzebyi]MBB6455318.1 aryl-alcohol dehydrogenase-like predicted oxidoreductase [Salirhabdus euzebyi]
MQKRQVGSSDLFISEISLGCMSLGTDEKKAQTIIDKALDAGINYLDTADLYDQGVNESIVGKAVKGKRENVIIGTKVGNRFEVGKEGWHWDPSKKYIKEEVKDSLRRLHTDYIDLYQLHGGTLEDPIDETIEAFEELKQEGLIRYYGISSIRPNVIREFIKKSNIVSVMMQYSLFDRRPEEEVLDLLHENNISVLARGPLAKGMLSKKGLAQVETKGRDGYLDYEYEELKTSTAAFLHFVNEERTPNAIALQYVLKHPALASAVFGASSINQLEENLTYLNSKPLDDNLYNQLKKMTKPIKYNKHR